MTRRTFLKQIQQSWLISLETKQWMKQMWWHWSVQQKVCQHQLASGGQESLTTVLFPFLWLSLVNRMKEVTGVPLRMVLVIQQARFSTLLLKVSKRNISYIILCFSTEQNHGVHNCYKRSSMETLFGWWNIACMLRVDMHWVSLTCVFYCARYSRRNVTPPYTSSTRGKKYKQE